MWKCKCGKEYQNDVNLCGFCGNKRPENDVSWYYILDGNRIGPVSTLIIIENIEKGEINADTLVWNNDFVDWQTVKETELKQYITNTPPPIKRSEISDKWLWMLATIPTGIGLVIHSAGFYYNGDNLITLLIIGLNCLFATLDIRYLEKAGIRTKGWMVMALFLVPVYLLVRASRTNRNYICLVVWCLLFALPYIPIW